MFQSYWLCFCEAGDKKIYREATEVGGGNLCPQYLTAEVLKWLRPTWGHIRPGFTGTEITPGRWLHYKTRTIKETAVWGQGAGKAVREIKAQRTWRLWQCLPLNTVYKNLLIEFCRAHPHIFLSLLFFLSFFHFFFLQWCAQRFPTAAGAFCLPSPPPPLLQYTLFRNFQFGYKQSTLSTTCFCTFWNGALRQINENKAGRVPIKFCKPCLPRGHQGKQPGLYALPLILGCLSFSTIEALFWLAVCSKLGWHL